MAKNKYKTLKNTAYMLLLISGLNLGLSWFFNFDFVSLIVDNTFTMLGTLFNASVLASAVYGVYDYFI